MPATFLISFDGILVLGPLRKHHRDLDPGPPQPSSCQCVFSDFSLSQLLIGELWHSPCLLKRWLPSWIILCPLGENSENVSYCRQSSPSVLIVLVTRQYSSVRRMYRGTGRLKSVHTTYCRPDNMAGPSRSHSSIPVDLVWILRCLRIMFHFLSELTWKIATTEIEWKERGGGNSIASGICNSRIHSVHACIVCTVHFGEHQSRIWWDYYLKSGRCFFLSLLCASCRKSIFWAFLRLKIDKAYTGLFHRAPDNQFSKHEM